MDPYEATKTVFQRIQALDPENASKIMGVLLIQDHGEKEMIRLAFGPESLVHSVILKARKELGLVTSNTSSTPSTPSSPSPFSNPLPISRQNSCSSASSRLLGGVNLPSPLSITNQSSTAVASSWSNSNFSDFQTSDDLISPSAYNGSSPSTMNSAAAHFYATGEVDLIDELQLQDQLSFLNDGSPPLGPKSNDLYYQDLASSPSTENDSVLFPSYSANWGGAAAVHRRSCSVSDICMGSDDLNGGFGWKPCLYYARGYCKNGTSCRFLHGGEGGGALAVDGGAAVGSPSKFEMMEQCQDLLRLKSTQQQRLAAASQLMASANCSYSPLPSNKCMDFLLQQQFPADSPRALMMGDGMYKFSRGRIERGEFGINGGHGLVNPGSRQIYLTFPADSTFKEEDVSSYFSIFGPVQDVRIPYQQKRMFGFVTFDYPETVKLILAKGNPHFVCDARVLVKPYKEKGKIPDKHRKQQQTERGELIGCGSPNGLESRDQFDLQLGARILYNQDMLWRRKLEEQAIELQNRRLMSLRLLDVKRNNHHRALSTGTVILPPSYSPTFCDQNVVTSDCSSPKVKEGNVANKAAADLDVQQESVNTNEEDKNSSINYENGNDKESPPKESELQESLEHNLPDSPFASPKAAGDFMTAFSNGTVEADKNGFVPAPTSTNNNLITGPSLFPATSSLDITTFKSCYFQVPRFASGHETIGM